MGWPAVGRENNGVPWLFLCTSLLSPQESLVKRYLFALLSAALVAGCQVAAQVGTPARAVVPQKARALPLSDVRVTGGPLKHAQDLDAQYLLSLEPNRMMAFLRKSAGLEPKAQGYG